MGKKIYAVMGATGQVGRALAEDLLRRGHAVRAIGRDAGRLSALTAAGARAHPAPFDDWRPLADAFRGASGVFSLIPPAYDADDYGAYQDRVGDAFTIAVRRGAVTHVVNLSSVGADQRDGTGPIAGLHRHEQRLGAIAGLHVLHLRPNYFMENLLAALRGIKASGVHADALRADLPLAMVATRDIAALAAEQLDGLAFRGQSVLELHGPRQVTMAEATAVLGRAIGKPDLRYVQASYADAEQAMIGDGMKPSLAGQLVEMARALNEGRVASRAPAASQRQGKTALEDLAPAFAKAWGQG